MFVLPQSVSLESTDVKRLRTWRSWKILGPILAMTILTSGSPASAQVETIIEAGASSIARKTPSRSEPVYFWYTRPACTTSPALTVPGARGIAGEELLPATISRASTSLATPRVLFSFNPVRDVGVCNPYFLFSEIVTDANYLYYVDNQGPQGRPGIWRRSRNANVEDSSELLVDVPYELTSAELLVTESHLYALYHGPEIFDGIVLYDKSTGALLDQTVDFNLPNTLYNMQYDSRFVYWIAPEGLRRYDTTNGALTTIVAGNVGAYEALGYFVDCTPIGCDDLAYLLYSKDNQLFYEESFTGTFQFDPLYTSSDPNADIVGVVDSGLYFFWIERRVVGGGFGTTENRIYRLLANTITPDLVFGPVQTSGPGWDSLTNDGTWLYFRDQITEQFLRIPNNAAAIAIQDLVANRIEITQGLQNAGNGQRLIEDKATSVRVYVESDAADNVAGVTAVLSGSSANAGFLGTLEPVNAGRVITVRTAPRRNNVNESFQFELPRHWTNQGALTLTATVNPARRIVEDDFADNSVSFGPIAFSPSARLHVAYFNFWYPLGGVFFRTTDAEVAASQRWMRKLYPIGEPGSSFDGEGLHFTVQNIYDAALSEHVARTHPDCVERYEKASDRNQCASDYAHARLQEMRQEGLIRPETLSYANIAPATCSGMACLFNRGYAINGVGSGPSDDENYAAHEVGHLLGREHPSPGSATCGHSDSDPGYPYSDGSIEHDFLPEDVRFAGLDRRADGTYLFLDGDTTFDTMTYCEPYWISEYTFEGMYDFLAQRSPQLTASSRSTRAALVDGDWLLASGVLDPENGSGGFTGLRRMDSVVDATPPEAGDFTLTFLSNALDTLASYSFAAEPIADSPGRFRFDLVVPFEPNAALVIVREGTSGRSLASSPISASRPVVSNVALLGAPSPVDDIVGLAWDASDADGDPLRFDVLATRDGGVTYRPIFLGVDGTSLNLDTSLLGGGTNRIRVVASDGVLTGHDESDPFEVVARAPVPVITEPADGTQVGWGQVVRFTTEVTDVQEEFIPDESIVWTNEYGEIGFGRSFQTDQLQVGENVITVTATNSLGESGIATVTVFVGDSLVLPGPVVAAVPELIAWHVGVDVSEIQATLLEVTNAGSGTLRVDVSSDSDWVTIDDASELLNTLTPASFIVRADPSAVEPATTGVALLTVENTANPEDVVVIPVQLARGNIFDGPATVEECDVETGECTLGGTCGNAVVDDGEACDDGDFVFGDSCGGDCSFVACGDADDSGSVTATDALAILRAAVGVDLCASCVCNVDGAGAGPSATDALRVLRVAVGQEEELSCIPCVS